MEEKKVLLVSIIPLWGYLSHGQGGQEIHDGHKLYKATIVPVLKFMFEVDGGHRKITTTLILTCDLGEGGGLNVNPGILDISRTTSQYPYIVKRTGLQLFYLVGCKM
jgi:hypothetical protein